MFINTAHPQFARSV